MIQAVFDFLPFLSSSVTSFILLYYKIPLLRIQQAVSVLLVVLLVLLIKQKDFKSGILNNPIYKFLSIYLLSLFIQLLVIATGGFFSPLLIVVHIYTLGVSILLNAKSSISFLVFTLAILILNTQLNSNMLKLFKEDPSSVILYIVSFLVIIPLAQTVIKTYHIKDAVSKKLGDYLQISENRSASLLSGLNDLVAITDVNLKIVSVNQAFEKSLKLTEEEVKGKLLLSSLKILDSTGKEATFDTLQINNILRDKYVRIIEDYSVIFPGRNYPIQIMIQVRPIIDNDGKINQIVFVFTDKTATGYQRAHDELDKAKFKQKQLFNQIQKTLISKGLTTEELKLKLLNKTEEDLLVAQELEDHALKKTDAFEDIAYLSKKIIDAKMSFASGFNVKLKLNILDDEDAEIAYFKLRGSSQNLANQASSSYTLLMDSKWAGVLVDRLLDICIFISSGQEQREVVVSLKHLGSGSIAALFSVPAQELILQNSQEIFKEYFGSLGTRSNLSFGSGLEGEIVKKIIEQLNYNLEFRVDEQLNRLILNLTFSPGLSKTV